MRQRQHGGVSSLEMLNIGFSANTRETGRKTAANPLEMVWENSMKQPLKQGTAQEKWCLVCRYTVERPHCISTS